MFIHRCVLARENRKIEEAEQNGASIAAPGFRYLL